MLSETDFEPIYLSVAAELAYEAGLRSVLQKVLEAVLSLDTTSPPAPVIRSLIKLYSPPDRDSSTWSDYFRGKRYLARYTCRDIDALVRLFTATLDKAAEKGPAFVFQNNNDEMEWSGEFDRMETTVSYVFLRFVGASWNLGIEAGKKAKFLQCSKLFDASAKVAVVCVIGSLSIVVFGFRSLLFCR